MKPMKLVALGAMLALSFAASAQTVQKKAAGSVAKGETYVEKGLASQGLDGQVYGEAGLSFLSYKIARVGISAKPIMLRVVAGFDYHPNLAAEAMLGQGLHGTDTLGPFGATYSVRAGTLLGAYAKPRLRLGDETEIFARLGVANAGTSVGGYHGTDGGAGLSYGLGFKTATPWKSFGNRPVSIAADYMTYYSGSGVKYTGITIGAGMRF